MSGIKGYPSQKKIISKLDNYTEAQSVTKSEFATVQPGNSDRYGLDVVIRGLATVASDAAEANSTKRIIKATSHVALAGDVIRFTSGTAGNLYFEAPVLSIPDANTIILACELPATPVATDAFQIKRYATPTLDLTTGGLSTTPGALITQVDSVDTTVNEDTSIPDNTIPLMTAETSVYSESVRNDYSSVNVTTGAWVQLIASTASYTRKILLFDGGGYAMELGFGAAAAETRQLLIPPGGFNGPIPFAIPAGTRLSIRAVGAATVSVGEICINLMY